MKASTEIHAHNQEVQRPAIAVILVVTATQIVVTCYNHGWPVPSVANAITLACCITTMTGSLHLLHMSILLDFGRAARFANFLHQYLTVVLRKHVATPSHAPGTVNSLLMTWLQARIFMQREDINLTFQAVSTHVAICFLTSLLCGVVILLHLFGLIVLDTMPYAWLLAVAVWAVGISYFMAYTATKLAKATSEQLMMLTYFRLQRFASADQTSEDEVGYHGCILGIIRFIECHDEVCMRSKRPLRVHLQLFSSFTAPVCQQQPPKILGVRVDPNLMGLLYKSVGGFLGAGLVSQITKMINTAHHTGSGEPYTNFD